MRLQSLFKCTTVCSVVAAENKHQTRQTEEDMGLVVTPVLLVNWEREKKEKRRRRKRNKIVGSQLKVRAFEVKVDIRGILLGRLNDVDDTESLLSPICWAPLCWAPFYCAV